MNLCLLPQILLVFLGQPHWLSIFEPALLNRNDDDDAKKKAIE